jgi:hypothetical protein
MPSARACSGSDEFAWTSFTYGMGRNKFCAMRGVISQVVRARRCRLPRYRPRRNNPSRTF